MYALDNGPPDYIGHFSDFNPAWSVSQCPIQKSTAAVAYQAQATYHIDLKLDPAVVLS